MTAQEHLQLIIGDLAMQLAIARQELDRLRSLVTSPDAARTPRTPEESS